MIDLPVARDRPLVPASVRSRARAKGGACLSCAGSWAGNPRSSLPLVAGWPGASGREGPRHPAWLCCKGSGWRYPIGLTFLLVAVLGLAAWTVGTRRRRSVLVRWLALGASAAVAVQIAEAAAGIYG